MTILRGVLRPDLLQEEILADIFEATVQRTPNKTALIFAQHSLSYTELNALADRVAHCLLHQQVAAGQMVGLWLPRGMDLLIAQLAIAKTGAAWLPFDADTPVSRIAVCLDDASSLGLLTCRAFLPQLINFPKTIWMLEDMLEANWATTSLLRRLGGISPDYPAYVIYTSGSTGKPKGIVVTQRSICHFLRSENAILGVTEEDRVYQGFSTAFDMSFEEIWIAYLVGATLWIAPREVVGDPEVLPQLLEDNHITVLHAVPTLLSLFPRDIPHLRLINLGGEMCPQALVERWATSTRKLFNTYGPTEATVSASLAELHRGEPVTIAKPLPNYGLLVVDEGLHLLSAGETGELCIIGPGVTAGYLGRADLTAEKFVANPYAQTPLEARLYRTGDLARIDTEGKVQCLGRIDDQIKIRGFRVELGEIEAVLAQQAGVGTAAVILKEVAGIEQLVAYFVTDAEMPPLSSELRRGLAQQLPAYMIPMHFAVLQHLPRLMSGKIDRKALRALPVVADEADVEDESDIAEGEVEAVLFNTLRSLFPEQTVRRSADFFTDMGGHSLLAARLVSLLRADARFANATIHDIFSQRTIVAIAAALAAKQVVAETVPMQPDIVETPRVRRVLCSLAQAATLPPLICLKMAQWLSPFFVYHYFTGEEDDSIWIGIIAAITVYLLANISSFFLVIAAKWLVLGRVKAGHYPLWGVMYFRWWLTDRIAEIAPRHLLSGSSLHPLYLRALGAKIGREVVIGALSIRVPDLLTVGNGASIGASVNFENARVERGELILGTIEIGNEATVDSYAVLEDGTQLGDFAQLGGLSSLSSGQRVPAGEFWDGSPSRFVRPVDVAGRKPRMSSSPAKQARELIYYFLGANLVSVIFFLPVFPSFIFIDWVDAQWLNIFESNLSPVLAGLAYLLISIPASAVLVLATVLVSGAFRWAVLPRLSPGTWPIHSSVYFCKWLGNQIQESSLAVLHGLYATVYAPWWYRLLGARVGRGTEISTALGVVPDMLTIGADSFVADQVMLGDERIEGGWMTLSPTVIGHRSFLGNGAFVPDGSVVPDDVLIGVQSKVPDNSRMHSNET